MAYRGGQDPGLPELDSQRRLREAVAPVAEPGVKGMKWGKRKGGGGLSRKVHDSLSTALDNEFDMRGTDPKKVAQDLVDFDPGLEDVEPKKLIAHIKAWQKKKGK